MISPVVLGFLAAAMVAWQEPAPSQPKLPAFMFVKGFPLACFDKPNLEKAGLELFVCGARKGIAGIRRKNDSTGTILVRNQDIAENLKLQAARRECGTAETGRRRQFSVKGGPGGTFAFLCDGAAIDGKRKFEAGTKEDWARFEEQLK